jgi:hypothetical protein
MQPSILMVGLNIVNIFNNYYKKQFHFLPEAANSLEMETVLLFFKITLTQF